MDERDFDETNDDEVLEPMQRNVTVSGESLVITPVTIGQYPAFARAVRPLVPAFAGKGDEIDVLELLAEQGDQVLDVVCVAIGREREWVGKMQPDAFIEVAQAVIEVNLNFFVQRLLPRIEAATDLLTEAVAGRIPSSP